MGSSIEFIADPKAPYDLKDYGFTFTTWLEGDTIATSTWVVPAGLTEENSSNTTTTTTIWLSGGDEGSTYELINRIVTAAGRKLEVGFILPMTS